MIPSMSAPARLTQFTRGGASACEIPPGDLARIVGGACRLPVAFDPAAALLVGPDSADDDAVAARSLSKPPGTRVLDSRHKATGEIFAETVASTADEGPRGTSENGRHPR